MSRGKKSPFNKVLTKRRFALNSALPIVKEHKLVNDHIIATHYYQDKNGVSSENVLRLSKTTKNYILEIQLKFPGSQDAPQYEAVQLTPNDVENFLDNLSSISLASKNKLATGCTILQNNAEITITRVRVSPAIFRMQFNERGSSEISFILSGKEIAELAEKLKS